MNIRRSQAIGILVAAAALTLAGCAAEDDEPLPVTTRSVEAEEPAAEAPEPAAEPSPEPEERGTRANPLAPDEARLISAESAFTVSGGPTTFDAWAAIQAENEYNSPPVEGRQFLMMPLTITVDMPAIQTQFEEGITSVDPASGVNPFWALQVKFVGNDGTSYGAGEDDYCGVIPNDWMNMQSVFDTATLTGNVCVAVPSGLVEGGTWAVSNMVSDTLFIAATA